MLDLQQLRYFVAVAEAGNVGRAAAALNIIQSPLSRQIQGLERHLGMDLFQRSKKRLLLNRAGADFLVQAKALLERAERVEGHAKAVAGGQAGRLVIGYVIGAIHAGCLPAGLRSFRRAVPEAQIVLKPLRSGEQVEALRSGAIDIGFTHRAAPPRSGLRSRLLHEEPFRLAFPAGRFPRGKAPPARLLDGEAFIAQPEAAFPEARHALLLACGAAGFRPDIRYEASDPAAVLGLVAAGLGLAMLQESLRRTLPEGVAFAPMPPRFPLTLQIHLVASAQPEALATRFLAVVAA